MLKLNHFLGLCLVLCPLGVLCAQLLGGDPHFTVLNQVDWKMDLAAVKNLCNDRNVHMSASDSTLSMDMHFFGSEAATEIRFDSKGQKAKLIQVKFKEATLAVQDSLYQAITRIAGKPPEITTTEKNALVFTLKLDMAKWQTPNEAVAVMTARRNDSIADVSLILYPAHN